MPEYQGPQTVEFDYPLPPELIAQHPADRRDGARMMVLHRARQQIEHRRFAELPDYLQAGDLVVVNNTKVIPARLFARKPGTGGRAELFLLEQNQDGTWLALMRCRRRPDPGQHLDLEGDGGRADVLSYCGAPIDIWRGGRWQQAPGWARPSAVRFARMAPRRGALCDIPDLELFPSRYGVRDEVMFRAALEVPLSQTVFAWLAALRRAGLLARPEKLAAPLHRGAPLFDRWGSALGGMFVEVSGLDAQGQAAQARWDIAADCDHGPEIPCMAAILLARRLARGDGPPPGAHTAAGLLRLDEFAPEFARWGMVTDLA